MRTSRQMKPKSPKMALAPPVFPNAGVDAWYRSTLQKMLEAMARDGRRRILDAWREGGGLATDEASNILGVVYDGDDFLCPAPPQAAGTPPPLRYVIAEDARPKPSTSALLERALAKWGGIWQRRWDNVSRKIAWDFAARNRNATEAGVKRSLKEAGFTVKWRPGKIERNAFDATVAENVALIKSIPEQFHLDVQQVVWDGVRTGNDLFTVADELQKKYDIAHRRAAFIATDQNHKSKAAMEKAMRLEMGITEADWMHSHAGKEPRPTHVAMDQKTYKIAEGMYDSAVDKMIWPGTEPRCRCTDRARVPGFR